MPKPKPFSRPSVNLDRVSREWMNVRASRVTVGDTIGGYGQVHFVEETPTGLVMFEAGQGNQVTFARTDLIWAFVEVESG